MCVVESRPLALERQERRAAAGGHASSSAARRARSAVRRRPGASRRARSRAAAATPAMSGTTRRAAAVGVERADVGGEIAERHVLLVADSRDDGHRAAARPHAPRARRRTAADPRSCLRRVPARSRRRRARIARSGQSRSRPGRARALHVGFGNHDVRRWKAACDVGQHVALGSRVAAGHQPDQAREARQGALARIVEEALAGELLLQPLERGEVRSEADPLDRSARAGGARRAARRARRGRTPARARRSRGRAAVHRTARAASARRCPHRLRDP